MKKWQLILIVALTTFYVGCDDGNSTKEKISCVSNSECSNLEECKFESKTSTSGACVSLTECLTEQDCSGNRKCLPFDASTNYCGYMGEKLFSIKPTTLSVGKINTQYSYTLQVENASSSFYFELKSGSTLPSGLTLSNNGLISGTPTVTAENHQFTVVAYQGVDGYFYNKFMDEEVLTITIVEENVDPCLSITCSENSYCSDGSCLCNENFHQEGESCVSNSKTVNCQDVAPENAVSIITTVTINWTEVNGWSDPSVCEWKCNSGYLQEGDICVEDECETGLDETIQCENGTQFRLCIDGIWEYDPCACNSGYHKDSNDVCVEDECDPDAEENIECSTDSNATLLRICIDGVWLEDDSCVCNQGYHKDSNSVCVEDECDPDAEENVECPTDSNATLLRICIDGVWLEDDSCVCNQGYYKNSNNVCVVDNRLTITWCNYLAPEELTLNISQESETVYGQVYVQGVTDNNQGEDARLKARLCKVDNNDETSCVNAPFNMTGAGDQNNNHQFATTLTFSASGDYLYYFEYSGDGGQTWSCQSNVIGLATISQ
ncbi:putative Ig domain-containing protein [bacterium]|nr:putative Ig domain-containing protein [bacterium]